MSNTVEIHLASSMNISFRHSLDTGVTREDWDEMSDEEQVEFVVDLIFESGAVEWWVDEP